MKVYVLLPLQSIKGVKIKEQNCGAARVALTSDYSECFGTENEYYINWESRVNKVTGWRNASYTYGRSNWFYTALNPQDVIKKKIMK